MTPVQVEENRDRVEYHPADNITVIHLLDGTDVSLFTAEGKLHIHGLGMEKALPEDDVRLVAYVLAAVASYIEE